MSDDIVILYNDLANKTWKRMVNLVGVHTVMVLVQRAVWTTCQKYGEAEAIEINEEGISFQALEKEADSERIKLVVEEFFGSLIGILTRLVGMDITQKLAKEIDTILGKEGE